MKDFASGCKVLTKLCKFLWQTGRRLQALTLAAITLLLFVFCAGTWVCLLLDKFQLCMFFAIDGLILARLNLWYIQVPMEEFVAAQKDLTKTP